MREIGLIAANYVLFLFLTIALSAAQSSLWFHVFGSSPAPYLWLIVGCYWVLTRNFVEATVMVYLTTFIFVTMSGLPLNLAFIVNISVYLVIFALKDRVLWSGNFSFMLASAISAGILPIFVFLYSFLLADRALNDFLFFEWIIRSLLTAIASIPLYYLFSFIDKITLSKATPGAELTDEHF